MPPLTNLSPIFFADILPSDATSLFPWSYFCFLSLNRKLWSTQGDSYKSWFYMSNQCPFIQSLKAVRNSQTLKPKIIREQCMIYHFKMVCVPWTISILPTGTYNNQLLRTICQSSKSAGRNKLECLIYEMLFTHDLKPSLKVQSDSTQVKLFHKQITTHTGMPSNDIHNLTLSTTLTFKDFNS